MRAAEELNRLQRAFPPAGADRCRDLVSEITPEFNMLVGDPAAMNSVVFGEVGRPEPNAYSKHFHDRSQFIVTYSGLLDLFQHVAEALLGPAQIVSNGQPIVSASRDMFATSSRIANVYKAWSSQTLRMATHTLLPASDLSQTAQQHADKLSRAMGMFVVAHELAHVCQFLNAPMGNESDPWHQTESEEVEADAQAVRIMFGHGLRQRTRTSIAGAAIALRILTGLEKFGHRFPDNYPAPETRISRMWQVLREQCLFESKFWSLTTMVFTYDEMMEVAENIVLGAGQESRLNPDRMFSRAVSILEEVVSGREMQAKAIKLITYDFQRADSRTRQSFAHRAVHVLRVLPRNSTLSEGAVKRQDVARLFWRLDWKLPVELRSLLRAEKRKFEEEVKDGDNWMP
jgi:hypothetical protein